MLRAASEGDSSAASALLPLVYGELRRAAGHLMRAERPDHTLEPTALVHEAYLKLVDQTRVEWQSRAHFFAVAAKAIRRILVDHARLKNSLKRGGGRTKLSLDERLIASFEQSIDTLALDQALRKLADTHPRHARIVEARFFGGMTIQETATTLDISTATVEREWRYARAVLFTMLTDDAERDNNDG
jgi:RNA polymerase sigma factor (TIGR02999 family)